MKQIRHRSRHPVLGWTLLSVAIVIICSYCLHRPRQSLIESRLLGQIIQNWRLYEAMHPGQPVTNVLQVFEPWGLKYPYGSHERLRIFGEHAGFERSLGEKYVFLEPPVKTEHEGGIVMISAKPFPDGRERRPMRAVILRDGENFQERLWSESWAQKPFVRDGRKIPEPPVMPPPSPPPPDLPEGHEPFWTSVGLAFNELEWHGVSLAMIRFIRKAVLLVLIMLAVIPIGYCLWPKALVVSDKDAVSLFTNRQKGKHVLSWTAAVTLMLVCFAMMPRMGEGGETQMHLFFPYAMLGEHFRSFRTPLLFFSFGKFPLYGLVFLYSWRENWWWPVWIMAALHFIALVWAVALSMH